MIDDSLPCIGALIVNNHGRIFVQRSPDRRRLFPSSWDIIGGPVPPGESIHGTLRREIATQTGWRLDTVLGGIGAVSYRGEDGRVRVEQHFLVRARGDLRRPLGHHQPAECTWLNAADLDLIADDGDPLELLARDVFAAGLAAAARRPLPRPFAPPGRNAIRWRRKPTPSGS